MVGYGKSLEESTSRNHSMGDIDDNNVLSDNKSLFFGDFREYPKQELEGSIDLIFTDPPYGKQTVGLYKDLGEFAYTVLREGGSLLSYVGHITLRECLNVLSESGLNYWWQLNRRVWRSHLFSFWKASWLQIQAFIVVCKGRKA